nr:inosine/uridine-preferring nucleoside hydrolase domain-containing protein [Tanacetum cinerariifolium]
MWDSFMTGIATSIMGNVHTKNGENEFSEVKYMNITVVTSNKPYGVSDGSNSLFEGHEVPKFNLTKNGVHSGHVQTSIKDPFCLQNNGNSVMKCKSSLLDWCKDQFSTFTPLEVMKSANQFWTYCVTDQIHRKVDGGMLPALVICVTKPHSNMLQWDMQGGEFSDWVRGASSVTGFRRSSFSGCLQGVCSRDMFRGCVQAVAELLAFIAENPTLLYCKVLEVVAETTQPVTSFGDLLTKIPSKRDVPLQPKVFGLLKGEWMSKMQPFDKEKMAQDVAQGAKEVAYNNDEKHDTCGRIEKDLAYEKTGQGARTQKDMPRYHFMLFAYFTA